MKFLLLLFWLTFNFCSLKASLSSSITNRIIHGTESFSFIPFVVGVKVNGHLKCGGALISKRWVLTAAHCFEKLLSQGEKSIVPKVAKQLSISAGDKCLSQAQEYKVFAGKIHNNYKPRTNPAVPQAYDVALLMTLDPIENLKTIDLPKPSLVDSDQYVEVAGWGLLRTNASCITTQMGPDQFKTCIQRGSECRGNRHVSPPSSTFCQGFMGKHQLPPDTHIATVRLASGQLETCYNSALSKDGWCHTDAQKTKWGFCMPSCQFPINHQPDCLYHLTMYTQNCNQTQYDRKVEMCAHPYLQEPNMACYMQQGNQFQLFNTIQGNPFAYISYKCAAFGDSGSPIWIKKSGKNILIAIVARGTCVAENTFSALYGSRIKPFLPWITRSKKELKDLALAHQVMVD